MKYIVKLFMVFKHNYWTYIPSCWPFWVTFDNLLAIFLTTIHTTTIMGSAPPWANCPSATLLNINLTPLFAQSVGSVGPTEPYDVEADLQRQPVGCQFVLVSLSLSVCQGQFVRVSLSGSVCHCQFVMVSLSLSVCHCHFIIVSLSWSVCHGQFVMVSLS